MVGYVGDDVNGPGAYAAGNPYMYRELVDKANAASTDDDMLNDEELEKFIESLVGGDITPEQARMLIKIYGNGDVVDSRTIVEAMTTDGFLEAVPGDSGFGSLKWGIDWDNIDGVLIANALYREVGLDPAIDKMTAKQFDEATDKLFGDTDGLNSANADFLARSFGSYRTLDQAQIAEIFELNAIHIDGVSGEGYTRIFVNYSEDRTAFPDNDHAADYIMSFDENGDGLLNREELERAIASRLADGASTDDDIMTQFMNYYGEKDGGGAMVVGRDDVMAMLNETSLNLAPRGDAGANGFGVNLHITPVDRVIHGYSYGDANSYNDGVMSESELVGMFDRLGLDVTPEQARFLIKVYGDGTFMTQADVQRMRDDGFMTTGGIMIDPVTLNWDEIDGVLLARAIFWAAGVDPNVEGATLTPEQFNTGVDHLFGDTEGQTLDDARHQAAVFGADGKLTVVEMGEAIDSSLIHIDGVAGEDYVRIAAHSAGTPHHHHDSWWETILKFFEGGAKEAVTLLAKYAGMAEEDVAAILNGTVSALEAEAMGADKIVLGLIKAVEAGEAEALKLLEDLGELIKDSFGHLSDQAKDYIDKLVHLAKTEGEEFAITFLTQMTGLPVGQAVDFIERMATKENLIDTAMTMTPEEWIALIPDYDVITAGLDYEYKKFADMMNEDPAARAAMEADGYSFGETGVIHNGRVLSESESQNFFSKYMRLDFALEENFGLSQGIQFNGFQGRAFLAFEGWDESGKAVFQLRFRILDEAGAGTGAATGAWGVDGGLVTVHDLVIPLSGSDMDIRWNSTLGFVVEGDAPGGVLSHNPLSEAVAAGFALGMGGVAPEEPNFRPGGIPNTFLGNTDYEVGGAATITVSYNLSAMYRDGHYVTAPMAAEVAGMLVGYGIGGLAALVVGGLTIAATDGAAAPEVLAFAEKYGLTYMNAAGMIGSFSADLIYAASTSDEYVSVGAGFSLWAAGRYNWAKIPVNFFEASGGAQTRGRIQLNLDYYSKSMDI